MKLYAPTERFVLSAFHKRNKKHTNFPSYAAMLPGTEYSVMKRLILSLILISALLLCGCSNRFGRGISIDGTDVSDMTMEEVRSTLLTLEAKKLDSFAVTLSYEGETTALSAADLGVRADVDEAILAASKIRRNDTVRGVVVNWYADQEAVEQIVKETAERLEKAPENAKMQVDYSDQYPFEFTEGEEGVSVAREQLADRLKQAANSRLRTLIKVPVTTTEPEVTLASLEEGRRLVASYTTSFEKSPFSAENRVYNIKKAAAKINGTELEPGASFDCNAVLGDRTAANGWKEATGIVNGSYEDEFGGGVCQVSSTLFNAVMMADLTVTERHPHSWPMGYVEIGRDATISTGGKNFCFTNASSGKIYISAWVDDEKKALSISIYGLPLPEGQRIEVASERTGSLPEPETKVELDESLPEGTEQIVRAARQGQTSKTYKRWYDAEDHLIRSEVAYEDTYRSIEGLKAVSPDIYYS